MEEKTLTICVYADTTGLYSEKECDEDNLADIEIPEEILKAWWIEENKKIIDEDDNVDLLFRDWYETRSCAYDTESLIGFARAKFGWKPHRPDNQVFHPDDCPIDISGMEYCPHCDSEIPYIIGEDDYKHYHFFCPVCGKPLMLCDLCHQDFGGVCDWTKEDNCWLRRKDAEQDARDIRKTLYKSEEERL